ncbi:MAG: RNA polymerase sigma factor [Elusimicrobia bacterium]|nr:MAG: RNA polymerase sigma factor [Elusimicrobiota bacterium]
MEPDRHEFERLVERHGPGLFSYLLHRLGRREDAEDAYAEVFMKAWQGWGSYQERGRVQAWLFTIAHRRVVDGARAASHRPTVPLEFDVDSHEAGPEREAEGGYARERIGGVLATLPTEQRDVFLMREYGGLSFKEIAETTGCPLATALARMRYAVLKLRASLGDLDA